MAFWPGNTAGLAALFSTGPTANPLRSHEEQVKTIVGSHFSAGKLMQGSRKFQGSLAMMLC